MNKTNNIKLLFRLLLTVFLLLSSNCGYAQKAKQKRHIHVADTTQVTSTDSITITSKPLTDEETIALMEKPVDTLLLVQQYDSIQQQSFTRKKFIPNSAKATWYALAFPGGGQIYNRKYWKLPIVYGGFVGCAYALNWNNKMYKDYSQAYLDIMDDDPNTKSYEDFLPPNYSIKGQESRFQQIFKKRKDLYRRQRDLSIFAIIGVYLLSVIDAYVDAELSDFDISKDLSLRMEPTLMENSSSRKSQHIGLQCSLKF